MEPTNYFKYLILSLLVIAWCVLHSVMISVSVTEFFRQRLGPHFRFYRLFFNLVSVLTLIPVVLYASSVQTEPIFRWEGYKLIFRIFFLGTAALLFFSGASHYDSAQFLGLRQIRVKISNKGLTGSGELDTSGVLSLIRHPWYLGAILLIWARPLDLSAILVNGLLTIYLLVGIYLEENKLVKEFGDQYRSYQQRVSRLFPYKWLKSKLTK